MNSELQYVLHPATERGAANHGWLTSHHSFSFGSYYNPSRMQFGALRVLNDDVVAPGAGFGRHPHRDMEIISIPTSGSLLHRDSMGNEAIIRAGEIQVMSAGTGVEHSEMNASRTEEVRFFQIWIMPDRYGVKPRYDQKPLKAEAMHNALLLVASPVENNNAIWLHQDATIHLARLAPGAALTYEIVEAHRGLYLFSIEGEAEINGHKIAQRDALAITGQGSLKVTAGANSNYLMFLNVPMK